MFTNPFNKKYQTGGSAPTDDQKKEITYVRFLSHPEKGSVLYYVAFGIGYAIEMVPNYLFSNWYTFGTQPDLKNASGFLLARVVNVGVQFGLLPLALAAFPEWRDDYISFAVIFIGGCINYLLCLLFFKKKEETQNPQ